MSLDREKAKRILDEAYASGKLNRSIVEPEETEMSGEVGQLGGFQAEEQSYMHGTDKDAAKTRVRWYGSESAMRKGEGGNRDE